MKTAYNLSYHNQNLIEKIISDIFFETEADACDFVLWFNRALNQNGQVRLSDVCDRLWIDIPEEKEEVFDGVGFNKSMDTGDIMSSVFKGGYVVVFPWLIDFNLNWKGLRNHDVRHHLIDVCNISYR